MNKEWDIVIINEDNSCEYIPSSWAVNLQKNKYRWPKIRSRNRIIKMIEECQSPSQFVEYYECSAVCKGTTSDLTKAKEVVQLAIDISTTKIENSVSMEEDLSFSENTVETQNSSIPQMDHSIIANAPMILGTSSCVDPCPAQIDVKNFETFDVQPIYVHDTTKVSIDKVIKEIATNLTEIKCEVIELKKEVNRLNQNFHELRLQNVGKEILLNNHYDMPYDIEAQLDSLEEKLSDKQEFDNLVAIFMTIGGTDKKTFARSIIRRLMEKSLAVQFSYYGRKGKKKFSAYKLILRAIAVALRSKFHFEEWEISRIISSILASSMDCNGSRKDRQKITTN